LSQSALNIELLPTPYREVLARNVRRLTSRKDVIAVGVAGSVARNDTWHASDLDIEIILKGESSGHVVCTEQTSPLVKGRGVSVDLAYFSEKDVIRRPYKTLPYDTRQIYDPTGLMTKLLSKRDPSKLRKHLIVSSVRLVSRTVKKANRALRKSPYSALGYVHNLYWSLAGGLTICAGENPTTRRAASQLEYAMRKIGRPEIFTSFGSLYGLPGTLSSAEHLLEQLRLGYREIWPYFHRRRIGPRYMLQQPNSRAWFQNRIEPLLAYDKRDLVCLVFAEFFFILAYLYGTRGKEIPLDLVGKSKNFKGKPAVWMNRYEKMFQLFAETDVGKIVQNAEELVAELRRMSSALRKGVEWGSQR
jgi:predicted nucleotidyltransferase